jgi:hypothetical protein
MNTLVQDLRYALRTFARAPRRAHRSDLSLKSE